MRAPKQVMEKEVVSGAGNDSWPYKALVEEGDLKVQYTTIVEEWERSIEQVGGEVVEYSYYTVQGYIPYLSS